jgi:hypothetical protein
MTKVLALAASIILGVFGISCQVSAQEPARDGAGQASIQGDWDLRVVADGNVYLASVTFTLDGSVVGGTLRTDFGESPLIGSMDGRTLKFTATIEGVDLVMTGELSGSEMQNGMLTYGETRGSWTGKRARAQPVQP